MPPIFDLILLSKLLYLNDIEMAGDSSVNQEANPLNGYGDVENGPLSEANRECRDIFCCLLFIAAIGGMGYLTLFGYVNGNVDKIFRATDKDGIVCGQPGGVAQAFPYAYFYNPTSGDLANRYCVASCPAFSGGTLSALSCYNGVTCTYDIQINAAGAYVSGSPSSIDFIGYDTSALLGRICIPSATVFKGVFSAYVSLFSSGMGRMGQQDVTNFMTDLQNNWKIIALAIIGCVIISFLFMFLLRCLAGLIVWGSILGSIVFFLLAGFVFLNNAGVIGTPSVVSGYVTVPVVNGGTQTQYTIVGYAALGLAGLLLIVLLCCCSRIRLAVAVCKCAGQFVAHTCSIIFVPIFQSFFNIALWIACAIGLFFIISTVSYTASSSSVFTSLSSYTDESMYKVYAFLFGTLWCNALIQAIGTFVVASACCMWYYNHGPDSDISFPVFRSYKYAFRYHLGSLAFGSFILALVQLMQILVEAVKKQAEASGANNQVFEYIINCLRCLLACVQRIVQFINKMAYIQMALRGKNFCQSAKDGFELAWSNPARYAIVGGVGEIMMFLGKVLIASGTTAAFYCAITYVSSLSANVIQPIYLLAFIFIISFAVGMLFMSVYSIAMDTILQCFIVDEANQKAKGQSTAKYAPEELQALIDPAE